MPSVSLSAVCSYLDRRLERPLPGTEAQLTMAPAYRMEPEQAQVDGKTCREAAVLALLHAHKHTPSIVLTVRRSDLHDHAGQVSFPGGACEEGERHRETALRETEEEVGIPADAVTVHGALTPLYIPPTGFCVYPFVGSVTAPTSFTANPGEVERIVHAPLATLLEPSTRQEKPWKLSGGLVDVPYFDIAGCTVWGATAMMLAELLTLMREDPSPFEVSQHTASTDAR